MRKLLRIFLVGLITVCIAVFFYSTKYKITNDKKQLEDNIICFINRPSEVANSVDIIQELNLDNKKYVLFLINARLGRAELTKGFNNKYKIEFTEYGTGFFRGEINRTNKEKYLVISGKNYENKIAYIKVLFNDKEYKINIPQQEYFMVNCVVPIETQQHFLDVNNTRFYNSNGMDITEEILNILFQ
jgi:hypothetical protein